jgi:23S rRNA (uracil1939-C5)-methyltransferase
MGKIIFVSGALPGDNVRARLLGVKKSFVEAETLEFLSRSQAIAPQCPHWEHCGGCPLQCMAYPEQLRWKKILAEENLTRIGRLERGRLRKIFPPVEPSPNLRQFRNKMEFAFDADRTGTVIAGLRERRTGNILAVPGCMLMPPEALSLAQKAAEFVQNGRLAPYGHARRGFWRFLTIREAYTTEDAAGPKWFCLCLTSPGASKEHRIVRKLGERLLGEFSSMATFVHEERKNRDTVSTGQKRIIALNAQGQSKAEAVMLHLPLGGKMFGLDIASFFQVNTGAAETLAGLAQDFFNDAGSAALLDAYCGVGVPGLLLAPRSENVFGFDRDKRAVALARDNASRMGLTHCRYTTADAVDILSDGAASYGTVLLDPPRAGIQTEALAALMTQRPQHILYISCNPATLARDAALMAKSYSLERLAGADIFPHTPGLECVSLWRKKERGKFAETD